MSKPVPVRKSRCRPARPTVRSLQRRLERLRERVEELEDSRELESAIAANGAKPLVPWVQAKKELGLG